MFGNGYPCNCQASGIFRGDHNTFRVMVTLNFPDAVNIYLSSKVIKESRTRFDMGWLCLVFAAFYL